MDLTPEGLATACSALFSGDRRPLYERLHVLRHRLRDWEDLEATLENATGLPVDGRCLLLPDIQAAVRASADAVARFDFRGDDRLGDAAFHFDIALHRDAHGVTDWRRDLVERLGGRAAFADVHASLLFPVYSLRTAVLRSSPGGGTRRENHATLTREERGALDILHTVLQARGHVLLRAADLGTVVPDAWTDCRAAGTATLFHCLFDATVTDD